MTIDLRALYRLVDKWNGTQPDTQAAFMAGIDAIFAGDVEALRKQVTEIADALYTIHEATAGYTPPTSHAPTARNVKDAMDDLDEPDVSDLEQPKAQLQSQDKKAKWQEYLATRSQLPPGPSPKKQWWSK